MESGESDSEIDTALLELEQECLQVYRRKVEQENQNRLRLHQCVAEKEAELAALYVVLGERLVHQSEVKSLNIFISPSSIFNCFLNHQTDYWEELQCKIIGR